MCDALRLAHERISVEMACRRLGAAINLCYVDEERGRVAVGVSGPSPAERRRVYELAGGAALRFFSSAPAVRHAGKQDYNRPLLGGIQITVPLSPGRSEKGTICMRQGEDTFVTAGHVVGEVGKPVYQPITKDEYLVGHALKVSNYRGRARSDSALVGRAPVDKANEIWRTKTAAYNVFGIYDGPAPGTTVSMQGASTQTALQTGQICAKNVTVTFDDGGTLEGQLLANYRSIAGDSGAPVFVPHESGNVLLVGLNVGATLPQDVQPPPDQSRFPPYSNGTYAVISPWFNVEADLGFSLGLESKAV